MPLAPDVTERGTQIICDSLEEFGRGVTQWNAGALRIGDICEITSRNFNNNVLHAKNMSHRFDGGPRITFAMYASCFSLAKDDTLENFCDGKIDKNLFAKWLIRTLKKENSDAL